MPDQWMVVVSGPKYIDELKKMPDESMSLFRGLEELLSVNHILGEEVVSDPYHLAVVHANLSRNLPSLTDAVRDEMFDAFEQLIPLKGDEWVTAPGLKTTVAIIARATNRLFVGPTLCRNQGFIDLVTNFVFDFSKTRFVINLFPPFLKPVVTPFVNTVPKRVQEALGFVGGMLDERLKGLDQFGDTWADKPNDGFMWLIEEAHHRGKSRYNVTLFLLMTIFTSLHTTAMSFTHALYHLASSPQYVESLREEADRVLKEDGEFNRDSLNKLYKIDAFLRETMRLAGVNGVTVWRKAMQDCSFSDGTFIPRGTFVVANATDTQLDEENYANPEEFNPDRFMKANNEGALPMTTTGVDYLPFGVGKHACPGRFFAAFEMKLMLAYIVTHYDVKWPTEGYKPANQWFFSSIIPDRNAQVMFRRRQK
ncbi:cytochrome P450 family protein [Abortiporus biennis]